MPKAKVSKIKKLNFKEIERKWQLRWAKARIFEVKEGKGKKFYVLEMFPYPSGEGLHMGHAFNYTIGDIYSRFKRMQGFNVLYPTGYDSLGLPAENAAIEAGVHPKDYTEKAIKNFIRQQKELGLSYDWTRMFRTHDSSYYKWDQWIFLRMLEKGIAYRKRAPVNWCPKCNTVLANEQVHEGKCWRHKDTDVEVRQLEQWFFKITDYAQELYDSIDKLRGWNEDVKAMQRNWIGKSHGLEINFKINNKSWPIFTTRPDTIYGVTFMVVSAQHPKLMELVTAKQKSEVEKFLKKSKRISPEEMERLEKEGVFTGSYATNPLTKEKVPVYAGNFVVAEYGSGMVMAVPAHDQRDFEFAKKYNIPIKVVIQPKTYELKPEKMTRAFTEEGNLVNSAQFDGMWSRDAIEAIADYVKKNKLGKRTVNYKLKDWLISRQRYWGTPIPIVYCDKCGIVPLSEKDLPIELPKKVKFGKGNPLATNKEFVNTKCSKCKGNARRETDTMDTFVNSSWYFLRFCDPRNDKKIFDKKKIAYWTPIDQYIGGKEHACMHLIYFRFYTKFLRDLGLLSIDEPTFNLFNQGMVCGPDGAVMSKSRGNVINPLDMIKKYSADILRLYLVSTAGPDKDFIWSDTGIQGSSRFIKKVLDLAKKAAKAKKASAKLESKLNSAIKSVTEHISSFEYNLAIIELREFFDYLEKEPNKRAFGTFLMLLHPFCPHITEELWHKSGHSFLSLESWPKYDEKKIDKRLEEQEKQVEKTKEDISNILRIIKAKGKKFEVVKIACIPGDLALYKENKDYFTQSFNVKVEVLSIAKARGEKKAKPGKPAIYVE